VVSNRPAPKRPRPRAAAVRIAGGSPAAGATVSGFQLWRADVTGRPARVEFWVDGTLRGTDVARPYTLGWDTAAEAPGEHRLLVKAIPARGRIVERATTVSVAEPT